MESYNMSIDNIHTLIKEALLLIDNIAKKNNLEYYLHAGSVLGAIRHNNLIPWDDDADIIVPVTNYARFIDCLRQSDLGKFCILYRDKYSTKMQAKLILKGQDEDLMCIDIFPLIGTSDCVKKQKKQCKNATFLRKVYFYKKIKVNNSKNIIKRIAKVLIKIMLLPFTERWFDKQFDKIMTKYDYNSANFVTNPCGKYKMKNIIPKSWYGFPACGVISGNEFPIPSNYQDYLKHYYNDFMKLPSKDYQKSVINKERLFMGTKEDFEKCIQE